MHGPDVRWYLVLAALLFVTGALGVLIRRSPLIILLSVEIMLNGSNLALIAFARRFLSPYATLPGELAMLVVVGIFAVALRWLRRMSQPTRRPAVLSDPPSAGVSR